MTIFNIKTITVMSLALLPSLVFSQTTSLDPINGSITLSGEFTPDPNVISVAAGGNLLASNAKSGCQGYVTDAPSYSLYFEPGSRGLGIYINSDFDTTILINDPSTEWFCEDDYPVLGTDAGWYFDNPISGRYDIWVGTYLAGDTSRTAVLAITEYADTSWETDLTPQETIPEISLSGGFLPDPYTLDVNVIARGFLSAATLTANNCTTGNFNSNASYRLNYSSPGSLGLGFYLISDIDTTIAIRDPGGSWFCDDDHPEHGDIGNDAGYYFSTPQPGNYDIYVGTFSEPTTDNVFTLAITEYDDGWLTGLTSSTIPDDDPIPDPVGEIQFGSKLL